MLSSNKFKSITARMLWILIIAFLLIISMTYWVVQTQAKPKIVDMTSEAVEETGNEIINGIMSKINKIDGLAEASSALLGTLPKEDNLYQQTFGNLMRRADSRVVGGGVWFDPNMYEWNVDRKSFAWQRNRSGQMIFSDRYDDKMQTSMDYYKQWWYTPAAYAKHDHCVWSRAYINEATKTPMITCAKAMYAEVDESYQGVVSFDIALDNIDKMMADWQEKFGEKDGTGGYLFLLDLDNRFLSFPDKSLVTTATEDNPQGEVITARELAAKPMILRR